MGKKDKLTKKERREAVQAEKAAQEEAARLHKEAVDRRNRRTLVGAGLVTLLGGGSLVVNAVLNATHDPYATLDEHVTPYSGTGDISLAHARADPSLRANFVEQAKTLLPPNHGIEDLVYVANEQEFVDAMMSVFTLAVEQGSVGRNMQGMYRQQVQAIAKPSLKKAATSGSFNVWAGTNAPEILVITPYLFSHVGVEYQDGSWKFFDTPDTISTDKPLSTVHWTLSQPDDVKSTLLHELVHVAQNKNGVRGAGENFLGRHARMINPAFFQGLSAITESQAYQAQVRDYQRGIIKPSEAYREHTRYMLDYQMEGVHLMTKLTASTNPAERILGKIASEVVQQQRRLGDF